MLGLKLCALGHSDPDTNFGLGNFTQYLNSEVYGISTSKMSRSRTLNQVKII